MLKSLTFSKTLSGLISKEAAPTTRSKRVQKDGKRDRQIEEEKRRERKSDWEMRKDYRSKKRDRRNLLE